MTAESLNVAHQQTKGFQTLSTLETTAGQGTASATGSSSCAGLSILSMTGIAWRSASIPAISSRPGIPFIPKKDRDSTIKEFDQVIGLGRLVALHVNDSMKPFGSKLDRHEHIGKGVMGLEGFRALMNDPLLVNIPKILETDKSEDLHEDIENMRLLIFLVEPGKSRGE